MMQQNCSPIMNLNYFLLYFRRNNCRRLDDGKVIFIHPYLASSNHLEAAYNLQRLYISSGVCVTE